jgi:hypothetical protein
MPWVVKECGRRGAIGESWEGFLLAACVTSSSFGLLGVFRGSPYIGANAPDFQKCCARADPAGVVTADVYR